MALNLRRAFFAGRAEQKIPCDQERFKSAWVMKERKIGKLKLNSIIVKYLLIFFLFGSLLILFTVSIHNDLSQTMTEELTNAQEIWSLSVLENNLQRGEWSVRDHFLYKGDERIGDGTEENANYGPFLKTEEETDSFVYSFIDTSLADEAIVASCASGGQKPTAFLRVAGSTTDANGYSIVGTFLDPEISEKLEENDVFTGQSDIGGRVFYCYYSVIRDGSGKRVGVIVAGRSIEELVRNTRNSALNSSLSIGILILDTFFALFLFVAKWNRSLIRMENYLTDIGNGAFPEEPLKISSGDELGEMAEIINEMKLSLAEKERLRNELALARTIQSEMLPDGDAAQKLPQSCRVSGFMAPAREVGGDLYDFFMIDQDRLGLVIADVSDKGAPAALFMATAKMCIKDNMMLGAEPKEVLKRVNNRLLENNKSGLFVTAWIAEVNLSDGRMKYAMAGHPYPFLRRAENAKYELLKSDKNLVLAGFPDFDYLQEETILSPGDRLFLYTDGLDEARDIQGGFFGSERIRDYLDAHSATDIQETIIGMKQAVDDYASGREQFDDLTMLMFEYAGGTRHE